jgi:predicted ArsR family transcriptional regulator
VAAADDVYSQLMKEWKCEKPALILAALTRLGDGDAASVAQLLSQHHAGVRDWLKRLAAAGCVKQVRGLGHAKSPAVYAPADAKAGAELLDLVARRVGAETSSLGRLSRARTEQGRASGRYRSSSARSV